CIVWITSFGFLEQGDEEIDTTKVDSTQRIEEYDAETQAAIRKIMVHSSTACALLLVLALASDPNIVVMHAVRTATEDDGHASWARRKYCRLNHGKGEASSR